ncbi:hypothetical protein OIU74_022489 [Salix koriyanagi]|uniref:Uncharacterized protein n=1 Tax=Salix koriyanagi TaxID=2511006 RepID=A0A9Q1AET1_9ROSI|nr:hypothetical protein OIU74_022489 [Salix koriyanagi]
MSSGIMERAQKSIGRGFDLTSDFRLKFCRGEERLVFLNETEKKELKVPGFGVIKDVSVDIKCDKGDVVRYQSDILEFHQCRCQSFSTRKHLCRGKSHQGCLTPCLDLKAVPGQLMQLTPSVWDSMVTSYLYSVFISIGTRLFSVMKSKMQYHRPGIPVL